MTKDRKLAGRVAVVTGLVQGIGQATAVAHAHAGADVIGVTWLRRPRPQSWSQPLAVAGRLIRLTCRTVMRSASLRQP